jgi:hypothetical protein
MMSIARYEDIHCLSDFRHGEISGIYYNDSVSFGTTYSGPPSLQPPLPTPEPTILGDKELRGIPTIVQMTDIQRIDVWCLETGCMGLMITYIDHRRDTLGRWDERSDQFRRETLFNKDHDCFNFDSMGIALKEYWVHKRLASGRPGSLTKSPWWNVNGISVGSIRSAATSFTSHVINYSARL